VIRQVSSLDVRTIAAIAAVVLCAAGSVTSAQQRFVESRQSNSTVVSHRDRWKNLYNRYDNLKPDPVQPSLYNSNDSLSPVPFPWGPNPDFCIECTWPEGSPTYYRSNGG
jgi:hypothetical protein